MVACPSDGANGLVQARVFGLVAGAYCPSRLGDLLLRTRRWISEHKAIIMGDSDLGIVDPDTAASVENDMG